MLFILLNDFFFKFNNIIILIYLYIYIFIYNKNIFFFLKKKKKNFFFFKKKKKRFCKVYADVSGIAINAIKNYVKDVKDRTFPNNEKNCYKMKSGEDKKLEEYIKSLKK